MNTITVILEPNSDGIVHLPVPPEWLHHSVKVKAELELVQWQADSATALKGFGALRGKISIAQDFDEPLADFRDYTV